MAESKEELRSLLIKVREESEKAGLKLNIQKTKIMASSPIISWQIDGKTMETVSDFIFWGSKITADGDCSHEIRRCLLLGRTAMTNLDSILKSRGIIFPVFSLVKVTAFPAVMHECESWTIKKAEHHDRVTSLSLFTFMHWRRKWQPTPVFLPGESQGWGSLVGCHLWGCTESDTTEAT